MSLTSYSDKELQTELDKREKQRQPPKPIVNPNYTTVYRAALKYIDDIYQGVPVDDDNEHWIFESVMEAVYGSGIWKYINSD